MAGEDAQIGIEFTKFARPLRRFHRGAINHSELLDDVGRLDLAPTSGCGRQVVTTAASLYRHLLDSGAFDHPDDDRTDQQRLAAEVLIVAVQNTQITTRGDLQLVRNGDCDTQAVRDFSAYWAAQLCDFVERSPAELRVQLVDVTAAHALDGLLPTELLHEALSAALHAPADEFPHRRRVGTTMALRFAGDGQIERAMKIAESFGPEAHHLLIEVAGVAPPESHQWPALIAALLQSSASMLTDGDSAAVLYAAANAAHANRPDAARALLTMAKLEQPTARDTDQPHEGQSPNPLRQIELHALAAVIFHALGDDSEALRHANASAALASAQGSSESENWRLPKAAGWLMAGAEEDPAARVRILKRSCCKYDSRGPLEGRLALQASTAYLELAEPELAAYFLARATEDAGSRRFTDHFPNSVHWGQVDALLESARVTEQELRNAGASLRKLGYLPEPEHGQRFRWIDEQWSRIGSDNPDLVSPLPKRV